jgi:putative transposase
MSRVYLRDPDGIYWTIPYSDVRQPPTTLAEVRAASRRLLTAGERHPSQRQVFASMAEQRALVEEAATRTQAARREQERTRRALHGGALSARVGRQVGETDPDDADAGPILPFSVEEWS